MAQREAVQCTHQSALRSERNMVTMAPMLINFARICFAFVILGAAFQAQAQAQYSRIIGTAGYLSEWELDAQVTRNSSSDAGEQFSGPLRMKHVGLCTVNGPVEKSGKVTLQITHSAGHSRLQANLLFDSGVRCSYAGQWSGRSAGAMDCSDARGIPLTLSAE